MRDVVQSVVDDTVRSVLDQQNRRNGQLFESATIGANRLARAMMCREQFQQSPQRRALLGQFGRVDQLVDVRRMSQLFERIPDSDRAASRAVDAPLGLIPPARWTSFPIRRHQNSTVSAQADKRAVRLSSVHLWAFVRRFTPRRSFAAACQTRHLRKTGRQSRRASKPVAGLDSGARSAVTCDSSESWRQPAR